jgi:TRAP-type C4-dicarboxylate transport system substrate-binding protein
MEDLEMKRLFVGSACAIFVLGFLFCAGNVSAKTITLKASSAWPKNHEGHIVYFKFFNLVSEKSGGSLNIKWTGGPELIKAHDLPTAAASGTIDIFTTSPGYYAGIVGEGPIMSAFPAYRDYESCSAVFKQMLPILDQEYGDKMKIKPIAWTWVVPFYMWTKNPVHSFEEMNGLKIRAHGGLVPHIAKALGLSPITMPSTDVYMALERGVIDGAIRNLASFSEFKEYEFAKYGVNSPATWASNIIFISLRSWDKLSAAQQKALSDAGMEITAYSSKWWKDRDEKITKELEEKGVKLYSLPPDVKKQWDARCLEGGKQGAMKLSPKHAEEIIRIFEQYGAKQ